MVSMQVQLYPGEQSRVLSHSYEILSEEEAEHLPASSPLAGVDSYSFPVADNATNILLTVESQQERHSAVYSVGEEGITELSSHLWLDIMKEEKTLDQQTQTAQEWQAALDETLEYYKDEIPGWLNIPDDLTWEEPLHDDSLDFDR